MWRCRRWSATSVPIPGRRRSLAGLRMTSRAWAAAWVRGICCIPWSSPGGQTKAPHADCSTLRCVRVPGGTLLPRPGGRLRRVWLPSLADVQTGSCPPNLLGQRPSCKGLMSLLCYRVSPRFSRRAAAMARSTRADAPYRSSILREPGAQPKRVMAFVSDPSAASQRWAAVWRVI